MFAEGDAASYSDAVIYFNEACSGCTDYLYDDLDSFFQEYQVENVSYRDYVNTPSYRSELNRISEEMGIPFELESHIMVFLGDDLLEDGIIKPDQVRVILAGHIPDESIRFLLDKDNLSGEEQIIIFQDKMPNMEDVFDYKAWAFEGPVETYDIEKPITTYINWYRENKDSFEASNVAEDSWKWNKLLPTVAVTGFLDGLNPCAFAVLLLFISYLFSIRRARKGILMMGIIYISAVYLAYLLIGFGLLKAILITGIPHFMAWVGSIAVIILGIINLMNFFFPSFPIKFKIPDLTKGAISEYMYKATLPAAFILGFVVGLCTFPCSGGPYVAVISLLSSQTEWLQGLVYLLLYNLMFVSPLIILLALAGNKYAAEKLLYWENSQSRYMHLISGLLMITLGLIIILFFI